MGEAKEAEGEAAEEGWVEEEVAVVAVGSNVEERTIGWTPCSCSSNSSSSNRSCSSRAHPYRPSPPIRTYGLVHVASRTSHTPWRGCSGETRWSITPCR